MTLDSALVSFRHGNGAAEAFTAARDRSSADAPWLHEVAFVEHHPHHDHLTVTGTFVGHYIDLEEGGRHASEHGTAVGFAGGAVIGMLFGPAGMAAGAVAGGLIGSQEGSPDEPTDPEFEAPQLVEQLRAAVPKGGSAVVLIAPAADVDAMLAAFEGSGGEAVRQTLGDERVAALKESLAATPAASLGPSRLGEVAVEGSSESG